MFQIKKIIKLKNVEQQQQKRPNSYVSNGFQRGQFTASYFFLFLQSTEQTEEVALHRQLCGLSWHCAFKARRYPSTGDQSE